MSGLLLKVRASCEWACFNEYGRKSSGEAWLCTNTAHRGRGRAGEGRGGEERGGEGRRGEGRGEKSNCDYTYYVP